MRYLNLLLAPIVAVIICAISFICIDVNFGFENILAQKEDLFVIDDILYPIMLVALIFFAKDFKYKKINYGVFLFLGVCAFFREMGAQKWLTTTDTSVTKIRFFTNPNNPISEKLIAGIILFAIFAAIIYLMIKFSKKIIKGFFNLEPLYWSIVTLVGVGILSKTLDRFPGRYRKATGELLPKELRTYFMFFEETLEFSLPIIVIIILIQYHYTLKKDK